MNRTALYLERQPMSGKVNCYLSAEQNGRHYEAQPVVMQEVADPAVYPEPTFSLSADDAQAFFNYLWENGYRPSKYEIPDVAFNAQADHLADMRRIAFKFLEMEIK